MESGQKFKFTLEELKKINIMLPKGFKFVTKEEILKKEAPTRGAPRKKLPLPIPSEAITPPQPKVKIQREQEYQPEKKVVVRPPPPPQVALILPDEEPAGTSLKLIQRLKRHSGYAHLIHFQKTNQTQITLRQIEDKANQEGEKYRINDLQADLNTFFLMVYKYSVKTSNDYRLAAELQNHLWQLLKIQRAGDLKRAENISRGNVGKKRVPPIKVYQPLASYKPATALQKRQLGMMIRKLSSQNLQQVIYVMFQSSEVKEYTFDLDNIHIKKFRELEQFVKKCMQKAVDWDPKMLEDEQFSNQSQFVIDNDDS